LLLLLIPYVVLAFCLTPNPVLERFGRHADISYGVYLYSYPIQQTLIAWFGPDLHPLGLAAGAMPLTWLCGLISWHAVEKRALRLKPRQRSLTVPSAVSKTPSAATHPMPKPSTAG